MARFELHLGHDNNKEEEKIDEDEEKEEVDEDSYEEEEEPETDDSDDDDVSTTTSSCDGRAHHQFSLTSALVAALRRSLVMCSVGAGAGEDEGCRKAAPAMEISRPFEVRHVAHVTFDRFGGFLGLPVELEPELPRRVPSASASVFGVSAESMQCSFDERGNSVPTILLSMQKHLYSQGGLQVEGIFRITAENSQELSVRDQLNSGTVPEGIDAHCLAGLIKAWFRELPRGVLDSLTPEQVMHCNSEEECTELVGMLPQTEAALLDWAINLMADVVENEHHNKMNARNIAMVFAPNMTQMADPLTALIHAVQVMNLLKTLITRTLREREEAVAASRLSDDCSESQSDNEEPESSKAAAPLGQHAGENSSELFDGVGFGKLLFCNDNEGKEGKCESDENHVEGELSRTKFRKGMWKLCRDSVLQFSRSSKKLTDIRILSSREGEREAWA